MRFERFVFKKRTLIARIDTNRKNIFLNNFEINFEQFDYVWCAVGSADNAASSRQSSNKFGFALEFRSSLGRRPTPKKAKLISIKRGDIFLVKITIS